MPLRAGDLRTRLVIQEETRTSDGSGGFTKAWQSIDSGSVWAKVKLLSGGDTNEAEQTTSRRRYEVTIRRRSDVTAAMRLVRNGSQLLAITSVGDDDEEIAATVLFCEEVPGST